MYTEIPLYLSILFVVGGLVALAWSSDLFVAGAASVARSFGISSFVVGMVVIGFGTSAPELCVSALSAFSGHSNLSLGNAYGSCVFNVAAILGVAALIRPLSVKPATALVSGPLLAAIALVSAWMLRDGTCSRLEGLALLAAFGVLMPLYCWLDKDSKPAGGDGAEGGSEDRLGLAFVKLLAGLAVLVGSSHILVWGAVDLARAVGVSDLMIGLTVIAVGTSLPELASAVASARRGEHEFVLGNIVGSNLFNSLAVVGLASSITPAEGFSRFVVLRDLPAMALLSLSITAMGANWRNLRSPGSVTRPKGAVWLLALVAYTALVMFNELGK